MRMKKAVVAGLIGVMSTLSLASCGSKSVSLPKEPAGMYKVANEEMAKLDNYELNGKMELAGTFAGQKVDVEATINAVYFKDPAKLKMDMNMAYMGQEMDMSMYFMKENDTYTTYTCVEDQWTKQSLDPKSEDDKKMIDMINDSFAGKTPEEFDCSKYISKSDEKAEDGTTALDFKLTGQDMVDLFKAANVDKELEKTGVTAEMVTGVLSGLGDLKATFVLDNKTAQWKSVNMDMKDFMQSALDTVMTYVSAMYGDAAKGVDMSVTVDKCTMNMTYDNLNKAKDFELPKEAKDAQEVNTDDLLNEVK